MPEKNWLRNRKNTEWLAQRAKQVTAIDLKYGCKLADIEEYFDNDDRKDMPRIISIILKKDDTSSGCQKEHQDGSAFKLADE